MRLGLVEADIKTHKKHNTTGLRVIMLRGFDFNTTRAMPAPKMRTWLLHMHGKPSARRTPLSAIVLEIPKLDNGIRQTPA